MNLVTRFDDASDHIDKFPPLARPRTMPISVAHASAQVHTKSGKILAKPPGVTFVSANVHTWSGGVNETNKSNHDHNFATRGKLKKSRNTIFITRALQFEKDDDEFDDYEERRGKKHGDKQNPDPDDDAPSGDDSEYLDSNWSSNGDKKKDKKVNKHGNNGKWKCDAKFPKKPNDYDGINLEYFQPWYSMLRVEVVAIGTNGDLYWTFLRSIARTEHKTMR